MFGLFKQKPLPPSPTPFGTELLTDLGARRMNLEERKQVRREMVYQSVRDNLLLLEIISGMYKFKAVGLDERQHRFMVVIDVATGFVAKRGGKVMRFNEVEKFLSERTFAQYGVRIDSIYWRFHPDVNSFGRGYRASDAAPRPRPAATAAPAPAAARPSPLRPSSRHEPVSEDEMRAFEQAIARGVKPPPLHLGDLEYQSDLAPLESPPVAGGTQYGSL
ncbi:MAG: hypothetical protein K2X75_11270 [Burkholderiaceae bacterium]|nr:hypothetical protein [Burkholderiaceae bacterium]